MKLYDKNAVAKFLDMTPKNVERLTQKGILQTKQGNLYALAETNRAYIKYLRDRNPESQEAVDLNEERAKLTKTKRLNEELDLAVKKGELHRSEDIEKVMTAMLINFKSRLSAIPVSYTHLTDTNIKACMQSITEIADDLERGSYGEEEKKQESNTVPT